MGFLFDPIPLPGKAIIAGALFASGLIVGGVGVHKMWNGHIKDEKIKSLEEELEGSKAAHRAEELVSKAYKEINDGYTKAIKTKDDEISSYALANVNLANSRAGSREVIYKEGKTISNEEQSKNPKDPINYCLGVAVNERMRLYANGDTGAP